MSNLSLQNTNYAALLDRLKTRKSKALKVAPNTEAILLDGDRIVITYHGNAIVRMYPDRIEFTNAGWGTATTRARLNIIADHNNVLLAFNQHKGAQVLRARKRMWNGGEWHVVSDDFTSVTWWRETDTLSSLDLGYYTFAL